jgi:pyroglutamyl-peptidase
MRRPRLLVTGFGPFPGITRNPSAETARRLAASPRLRALAIDADVLILPTTYAALDEVLAPALTRLSPDAVLMIGVAGRARRVRVEGRALNRASVLAPDARGRRPERLSFGNGPAARLARSDVGRIVQLLRRRGVACEPSRNAGRYLCNAAYYRALAAPMPVLFIHIPKARRAKRRGAPQAPRPLAWQAQLASALENVALDLLASARRDRPRS